MSYTLVNPATGEDMESIEHASVEQTDDAIERARVAQKEWASLTPAERAAALRRFARVVEADVDNLASLEVRNSGHPIGQARWEANHVVNVLDYYSAAPERLLGKQIPVAGGVDVTFNEPLGVVGVITPWNFPMTIASWGFAPALAAGNAVVLKPAEWTPLTSLRLAELGEQAGLPDGLFQVIAGKGSVVGNRFITNDTVRKVVFTGSTEVGKQVMRGAADQIKRVTLELGERAPTSSLTMPTLKRPRRPLLIRCSKTRAKTVVRAREFSFTRQFLTDSWRGSRRPSRVWSSETRPANRPRSARSSTRITRQRSRSTSTRQTSFSEGLHPTVPGTGSRQPLPCRGGSTTRA